MSKETRFDSQVVLVTGASRGLGAAFAKALAEDIERDMQPRNSYLIDRRLDPLSTSAANSLIHSLSEKTPIDLWPIRYTTSYRLRRGKTPVPVGHPAFHTHWKDMGSFPQLKNFTEREIYARMLKAFGQFFIPLL